MHPDDAIGRFERHLQAALDRFAQGLRRHIEEALPVSWEAASSEAAGLDRQALEAEEARLRRKARRNAPCYDLNRHIAVRRLLAHLAKEPRPAGA